MENTGLDMADASERILEHRHRREQLEAAAEDARAVLAERRELLDGADMVAAFAADMSEFLRTSELTETKAFVRSFVKEIEVAPGKATIVYTIPTPSDSPIGGADKAEIALGGGVMNTVQRGGPDWTKSRTEADSRVTRPGAWGWYTSGPPRPPRSRCPARSCGSTPSAPGKSRPGRVRGSPPRTP